MVPVFCCILHLEVRNIFSSKALFSDVVLVNFDHQKAIEIQWQEKMEWPSWSVLVTVNLRELVSPTCPMNKLIFTEKSVSLFQVKIAYINFLNHCYVDTEVEMKEIYTSNHMWKLFENFLVDICRVRLSGTTETGEGVCVGLRLPVQT